MRGLIILDGPDGAGKTSLAREIVRQTGGVYMHQTYRWKDRMFTYHLAALHRAIKLSETRFVVIDRLWMSEVCYANAYRGGSTWPLAYRFLERLILKHAALEVVCLPENLRDHLRDYETLKNERDEMYSDISPVCIEYHKLWDKVKDWPHVRRYCVQMAKATPGFMEDYAATLIQDQQDWREEQLPWILEASRYNITGHISPAKYVFVGGANHASRENWYPFVEYGGACAHLARVLEELNIPEHEIMMTCYDVSKEELGRLVPEYDLKPYVFGTTTFYRWVDDNGGMDKMRVCPIKRHKVLTMTYLNDARSIADPHYDFTKTRGRQLKCDLGGEILRQQAYGRTV